MTVLTENYKLNNGIEIPKLGFGTWQTRPGKETFDAVSNALKVGYRFIDTAAAYYNEASVGQAIKESGLDRKDIFVQTKLPGESKSYQEAIDQFQSSLEKLGLEYVDSYIIHAPWPWNDMGANFDRENREVWRALEDIYDKGLAKAIGVSNFNSHDLNNLLQWDQLRVKPSVDQIQYYIGHTQDSVVKTAQDNDILIQAYSPLATGSLLSNKKLTKIADKYGVSTSQLALRFCLDNGTAPLPKARSIEHIRNNTELDFEISEDDLNVLKSFNDRFGWHPTGD
ncbi:aldo/keto reductase [Oenococcus alcoholitolerans]|uniref:2,5-diketo-D-gluconic acid reductase n=1 Tax=Oenococcus alcoholitolerans TaxID=931074 RepID=A0ABR4XRW2_9LACO|nr:2,5-diketo-D-gluconic acid reductase [Oenococcus alcoholitolerans]